jgi:hypothetical protein
MRVMVGPRARWAPEQLEQTNTPKSREAPGIKMESTGWGVAAAVSTMLVRFFIKYNSEYIFLLLETQHKHYIILIFYGYLFLLNKRKL